MVITKTINGKEVDIHLTEEEVYHIYRCYRDEFDLSCIKSMLDSHGYDIDRISDETIGIILLEYQRCLSMSEPYAEAENVAFELVVEDYDLPEKEDE